MFPRYTPPSGGGGSAPGPWIDGAASLLNGWTGTLLYRLNGAYCDVIADIDGGTNNDVLVLPVGYGPTLPAGGNMYFGGYFQPTYGAFFVNQLSRTIFATNVGGLNRLTFSIPLG